jgi:hypothetical protein
VLRVTSLLWIGPSAHGIAMRHSVNEQTDPEVGWPVIRHKSRFCDSARAQNPLQRGEMVLTVMVPEAESV